MSLFGFWLAKNLGNEEVRYLRDQIIADSRAEKFTSHRAQLV